MYVYIYIYCEYVYIYIFLIVYYTSTIYIYVIILHMISYHICSICILYINNTILTCLCFPRWSRRETAAAASAAACTAIAPVCHARAQRWHICKKQMMQNQTMKHFKIPYHSFLNGLITAVKLVKITYQNLNKSTSINQGLDGKIWMRCNGMGSVWHLQ